MKNNKYINLKYIKITKLSKKSIKDEPIENNYQSKSRVKLTVSKETKEKVMSCIPDLILHHPELEGMNITENYIVMQLALFWKRNP